MYNRPMRRTTIVAPDDLLERLRHEAAERGVSLATVIREALEDKARAFRPKPRSLGLGDSGRTDVARRTAEEQAIPEPWR
jgi:hypothetical protein